jgi:hypothetical protein
VDHALQNIEGYNEVLFLRKHRAWGAYEARFGKEQTEKTKAAIAEQDNRILHAAMDNVARAGIPGFSVSQGKDGSLSVSSSFSFAEDGSTYSVSSDAHGKLVGSKDGQTWKTWQTAAPPINASRASEAEVALAALQQSKIEGSRDAQAPQLRLSA